MKGTELSPLHQSNERANEMHEVLPLVSDNISCKLRDMELYQGQTTWKMHSPVKDQYGPGADPMDRDTY